MRKYNSQSVLVIVDVEKQDAGLPTEAYIAVDEVSADGSEARTTFANVPSEMGAEEAEEVGVEHLLRDIKTQQVGTLSYRIGEQLRGLVGLESRLREIARYLDDIIHQHLPINHQVRSYGVNPDFLGDFETRTHSIRMFLSFETLDEISVLLLNLVFAVSSL